MVFGRTTGHTKLPRNASITVKSTVPAMISVLVLVGLTGLAIASLLQIERTDPLRDATAI